MQLIQISVGPRLVPGETLLKARPTPPPCGVVVGVFYLYRINLMILLFMKSRACGWEESM